MEKRKKSGVKSKVKAKLTKSKSTHVVVKKHHAKPYRKRHYGALVLIILLMSALASYVAVYRDDVLDATRSAKNYISDVFKKGSTISEINSSYGFTLSYDSERFYTGAIDTASGELYFGNELSTRRSYEQIRVSSSKMVGVTGQGSMTMQYYPKVTAYSADDSDLVKLEAGTVDLGSPSATNTVTKLREEKLKIDGRDFIKTEWSVKPKALDSKLLETYITTYRGQLNSKAIIIKISKGASGLDYSEIVNSIKFGSKTVVLESIKPESENKTIKSGKLLNSITFTAIAKAESMQTDSTEVTAAKYSPAVVQIWNFYCMDISFYGKPFFRDACDASIGSGFFVSSDGYIASNGHVVTSNPKDIAIGNALYYAQSENDNTYIGLLIKEAGITNSDLNKFTTLTELYDFIVDKLYSIDDSKITATNQVSNLLVQLNDKKPDVEELFTLTEGRKEYAEQDSIKRAKVTASDYRVYDGYSQWHASDVAIAKIDGDNYPVVKTGSIKTLTQGSALTILGYPAQASDNSLVDGAASRVTLTSGKVSSIKDAKGSSKKLIETDTTIGHGNSGGPAFDSNGQVVGLATYTLDGSGSGNGVFNYIRDIADLLDVAKKASISLKTTSTTQTTWEEGLDLFYNARFSKAVKKFEKVKTYYAQHSKADEFIASANERIKNGEDVKDFPYLLVGGAGLVLVLALVSTLVVVKRHKVKHNALMSHINTTGQNPFAGGDTKSVSIQPQVTVQPAVAPAPPTDVVPQPQQPSIVQPSTHAANPEAPTNTQPPA